MQPTAAEQAAEHRRAVRQALVELKTEWVNRYVYRSREEAKRSIYFYIEMFYNSKRRHATLGYLTPNQFETQHLVLAV